MAKAKISIVEQIISCLSTIWSKHSSPDSTLEQELLQSLHKNSNPSHPISSLVHFQSSSSFSSILRAYIRNLRFDEPTTRKPILIITPTHVSHIQAAILTAKSHGLQLKTRSGGHDYEGVSYVSNVPFILLDIFNLRGIHVNVEEDTAWVQTGATLGELFYRINKETGGTRGFPAGVCPTVGVGGHLSGGGYGNLQRKYGLSIDNIVDAEIITVDGTLLNRESMGEDLFWAITGGGGVSFGVVLSYKIKLVPIPLLVTVFQLRRSSAQENVLNLVDKWQRVADKLDNDIFIRMILDVEKNNATGEKSNRATFVGFFLGNSEKLIPHMDLNFPELGLKKSDCMEMSWPESILFWADYPTGTPIDTLLDRKPLTLTHLKRKSDFLKNPIPRSGLESIFRTMIELERPKLYFNPYGGRMAKISDSAKPFPHRAGNIALIQYNTNWEEGGVNAANHYINLTRKLYNHMTPFVSKNPRDSFLNYRDLDIGTVDQDGGNSYSEATVYGIMYFKGNFERLVKVKTMVDPDNFFRNEQSIPTLSISRCKSETFQNN